MPKMTSWRSLLTGGCLGGYGGGAQRRRSSVAPKGKVGAPPSSQRVSSSDTSTSTEILSPEDLSLSLAGSNLYVFTLAELKDATKNFSMSNFLGKGGFGPVYKGFIDDEVMPGLSAQTVAVKLLDLEGPQGHKEWLAEVMYLAELRHPHLVKLIGYCYEDEHRMLVYEFMARGSLEKHLFKRYLASLSWSTRLKIAVGAAKGLAFLHEHAVIYRDFKASNILIDPDYKSKLSDFGLAKDGPMGDDTHVSTRVMGTRGYAAPEYIMTGHLTAKSDVYSFGVVLLELMTGRKSVDKARPSREQNLVEWARHCLNEPRKLNRIMDPSLEGQYSNMAMQKAAALAYECLSQRPKARPQMSAIVETLEPLLALEEAPVKPFVYVAPTENHKHDEEPEKPATPKEEGGHHHRGQRHKMRSPRPGNSSDAAFNREVANRLYRNSPTRHKESRD